MISLFCKIYKLSFYAIQKHKEAEFAEWIAAKAKVNADVNTLVFTYLSRKCRNKGFSGNAYHQQFYLDVITALYQRHVAARMPVYNFAYVFPVLQRQLFVAGCLVQTLVQLLIRWIKTLFRFRFFVEWETSTAAEQVDICIGFPHHAFACEENKAPGACAKSFAEYYQAIVRAREQNNNRLVSVDEYQRHSRKHEIHEATSDTLKLPRITTVAVRRSWGPGKTYAAARKAHKQFFSRFESYNPFLLVAYLEQWHQQKRYEKLLLTLVGKDTRVQRIYMMFGHPIGLLKYDPLYAAQIHVFSYSQNVFGLPAKRFSESMSRPFADISAEDIMEECELPAFSFYMNNACAFTEHLRVINTCKTYINSRFLLQLQDHVEREENTPSNLGYESFLTVDTKTDKFILLFDIPLEAGQTDLHRCIIGDKTVKPAFIEPFYEDIFSVAQTHNYKIILKPKYSLASPACTPQYRSLVQALEKRMNGNCIIADPYNNIRPGSNAFSLSISFPFTSTYYTMADVTDRSVYYVPDGFRSFFSGQMEGKLVIGRHELENIIKHI
jgi:hypothetical protein